MRLIAVVAVSACVSLAANRAPDSRLQERSGGTQVVSPSVLASSSLRRNAGTLTIDILILWRGSPGWQYRRTSLGGWMSGGSTGRDGIVRFTVQEGGVLLTADFNPSTRTANVLGERVNLGDANVILVDRVDAPDGPVTTGTRTLAPRAANPMYAPAAELPSVLRESPELFEYLRCHAQISASLSHPSMAPLCAEAILKGFVKTPPTVVPVPAGPVSNRAAATAPPERPQRPPGAGTSQSHGVASPTVVAGWFTSGPDTNATLDLLVLWRGTPGWPLRGTSSGGSGGGGPSGRRSMTVRRGELHLYAAFDGDSRTAQIEERTIKLGDHNVVLIDDADSERGPRVVKTLRVDPALPDSRRVDTLIAKSQELRTFMRCDVQLPDPRQQAAMDRLCSRYVSR